LHAAVVVNSQFRQSATAETFRFSLAQGSRQSVAGDVDKKEIQSVKSAVIVPVHICL